MNLRAWRGPLAADDSPARCRRARAPGCSRPPTPSRPQAWGEGGYSDDLTVAAKCTESGLVIYCPSYSIFPQW